MRQAGDNLDLTKEPFRAPTASELISGCKDLNGDLAVMLQVFGQGNTAAMPPRPISDSTAYRSASADFDTVQKVRHRSL